MKKNRALNKTRENFLHKQLKEYEATIGIMTADERKELHEWVAAGNSVHDNPCYIYGEDGCPMDYINAIRCDKELKELCEEMRDLTPEQLAEFEWERDVKGPIDPLTANPLEI